MALTKCIKIIIAIALAVIILGIIGILFSQGANNSNRIRHRRSSVGSRHIIVGQPIGGTGVIGRSTQPTQLIQAKPVSNIAPANRHVSIGGQTQTVRTTRRISI